MGTDVLQCFLGQILIFGVNQTLTVLAGLDQSFVILANMQLLLIPASQVDQHDGTYYGQI